MVGTASPAAAAGRPPVAVNDAAKAIVAHAVDIRPTANDKDPDGGPVTLRSARLTPGSASSATLAIGRGAVVRITPKAGFIGRLTATYAIADRDGMIGRGAIFVTVAPANHRPVPRSDTATVVAGRTVTISPLSNDRDPDKDRLRLIQAASGNPKAGSVTLGTRNRLVIRAEDTFTGRFNVTYVVADGRGGRAQGTVAVTVKPVPPKPANHKPIARADSATVWAGSTTRIKVIGNDSDPDRDRLTLVSVGKASAGTATRKGSRIRFNAPSKAGKASVRYTIRDSQGATASAVLTITVKARPASTSPTRSRVEAALRRLRLPVGAANGRYDGATRRALCAWRTITGRRAHRGLPSTAEAKAILATDGLPRARSGMVTGVTISVTCQAAFWVGKNRHYKRVMAACTGKPGYRTRTGTFRVFRSFTTWRWSTIYPEARMYKPMQFSGGQAMHGSSTDRLVKSYPASHGCVRMFHRDINAMHGAGLGIGTRVKVVGSWRS